MSNFAHFSTKCIYIIMVDKGRSNMQNLFKILKFIVIYIILKLLILLLKVQLWYTQITGQ